MVHVLHHTAKGTGIGDPRENVVKMFAHRYFLSKRSENKFNIARGKIQAVVSTQGGYWFSHSERAMPWENG